jgi:hypothetical protein
MDAVVAPDGWLNDKVVDAVNSIVARKIGSDQNQSTLLAQIPNGFAAIGTEAVHVLHSQNHWVATACIGNEVLYADSMGNDKNVNDFVATTAYETAVRWATGSRHA